MTRLRTFFIVLFAVFLVQINTAQTLYASALNVRYEGVELLRANTTEWLPLNTVGTIAPFGEGDIMRTDVSGRASLTFGDAFEILILPNSTFELTQFAQDDTGTFQFEARVQGVMVQSTFTPDIIGNQTFVLENAEITITDSADLFSLWVYDDQPSTITVAEGELTVFDSDNSTLINANQAYRFDADEATIHDLDQPLNAPRLTGILEGCLGTVQTEGNVNLFVRTGIGRGFQPMDAISPNTVVPIMGVTESGWARIQFLSGFGWLLASALVTECTDLPTLPDDSPEEQFLTVINVTESEVAILQPFFGRPIDDRFFYQTITESE